MIERVQCVIIGCEIDITNVKLNLIRDDNCLIFYILFSNPNIGAL